MSKVYRGLKIYLESATGLNWTAVSDADMDRWFGADANYGESLGFVLSDSLTPSSVSTDEAFPGDEF